MPGSDRVGSGRSRHTTPLPAGQRPAVPPPLSSANSARASGYDAGSELSHDSSRVLRQRAESGRARARMQHSRRSAEPPEYSPFVGRPNYVGAAGFRRQHEGYGRQSFNAPALDLRQDRRLVDRTITRPATWLSAILPVQRYAAGGAVTSSLMEIGQTLASDRPNLGQLRSQLGKQTFRMLRYSTFAPTTGYAAMGAMAYAAVALAQITGQGRHLGQGHSAGSEHDNLLDQNFGPNALERMVSGVKEADHRNWLSMGENAVMQKVAQGVYNDRKPEFMNFAFHFYRMRCAQGPDGDPEEFRSALRQADLELGYPMPISEENAQHCRNDPGFRRWLQTWPPNIERRKPPEQRRSQAALPGMGGGALDTLRPPRHHGQGYNPGRFPGIPPRAMANLNHMRHMGTPHREYYPRHHHSYSHDGGDGFGGYNQYNDPYYGGAY
jgi:hypothetical protein